MRQARIDQALGMPAARTLCAAALAMQLAACGTLKPPVPEASPVVVAAPDPLPQPEPVAEPPPSMPAPPPAVKRSSAPADAKPRVERIAQGPPNHPYSIKGVRYVPHDTDLPMSEIGVASWYGEPFHGRAAATGERYDMNAMTAAHPTMPLPSYARVRNLRNGREIIVRVNDRGPFVAGRVIDLSRAAARRLGFSGLAMVEVTRLTHDDIRTGAWRDRSKAPAVAALRPNAEPDRAGKPSESSRAATAPPERTVVATNR